MRFEITSTIHYGYVRPPGIYDDLTEADAANLSAPRPGLPNGYGRALPDEKREEPIATSGNQASDDVELLDLGNLLASQELKNETTDSGPGETTRPTTGGAGSSDQTSSPTDPPSTSCPECGKDFADKDSPAVSVAAHRRATGH